MLLGAGAFFLLVSLSYAEGTAAIPETGGAATFVRRAFNDLAGFVTGWALFLDYLIVIALSTLFLPHYLAAALDDERLAGSPWDIVVAVVAIAAIAGVRLVRRTQIYRAGLLVAGLDLITQLMLVVLGLALLLAPEPLAATISLGEWPGWEAIAFALPLAMLAYTGLETVANLAEEAREPGRTLPRSLFSAIGLVVIVTATIAVVGVSALPAVDGESPLGNEWLLAPISGIAAALAAPLPAALADALRVFVGLVGAIVLFAAATTSISGCTRLAHSLGGHGQLPRAFGRLNRRTLVSPQAIVSVALVSIALVDRGRGLRRRRRLPREPLLVRRPARVRSRTARRDPPPLPGARAAAAVPGPVRRAPGGSGRAAARRGRAGRRGRRLDPRARDARGRALRGAGVARARARRLRRRAPPRAARPAGGGLAGRDPAARSRVPAPARADEAGGDRRGDGRHRDRARQGARGGGRRALRDPRPARAGARRRAARAGRGRRGVFGRGRRCSARSTTSPSTRSRSGRARSGRRSWPRRRRATPT